MQNLLNDFKEYMINNGKSQNTISSYLLHVEGYLKWYNESFGGEFTKLHRQNILEYKSYLQNVLEQNAKTINAKLAAIIKLNEYLVDNKIQEDTAATKRDYMKVQNEFASPAIISKKDVEAFRQKILEKESKRDYAIITVMAYAGLRISEVLSLKQKDVELTSGEIIVRDGKGNKQRVVYINDKIINAIKEHLKDGESYTDYLFISNRGKPLNRTVINRLFNKHSKIITPHTLRHFYCSNAIEVGYSVHEVANQAGHSNIHTTLMYTNPTREEMKRKSNLL